MNKLVSVCFLSILIFTSGISMAEDNKLIVRLTAKQLQAIMIAKSAFIDKKLEIDDYNIQLWESDSEYVISFEHSSKQPQFRGSPPGHPGFTVLLNKETLEINKSHFVR
jgi:hypothetical protein